ncbi:MAG: hypothetical protein KUF80_18900, partial [Candidatus Thiodiazotropha sp. (ex Codakia orbicularis)]|nr:hypothetical protein [Candidatus Thiodiazotropha sp. (ex Codakia orbicularis)]
RLATVTAYQIGGFLQFHSDILENLNSLWNGTYLSQEPPSSAKKYRHPGAGRDPECLRVTVFLDSGLRRNDENPEIHLK